MPYLIFWQVLGLILLMGRTSSAKDVELLVLRHEVAVLRRANPRPRMDWAHHRWSATLARVLAPRKFVQVDRVVGRVEVRGTAVNPGELQHRSYC